MIGAHFVTEDGEELEIIRFLDAWDEETDDEDEIVAMVVRAPDGEMTTVDLIDVHESTLH
ncbi:hypothetical protein [Roseibium sp.]|uniref:hypothetical protein n=1 Tax=Roseibium sp. TaxID=1936156 RepID=UPI00327F242A